MEEAAMQQAAAPTTLSTAWKRDAGVRRLRWRRIDGYFELWYHLVSALPLFGFAKWS